MRGETSIERPGQPGTEARSGPAGKPVAPRRKADVVRFPGTSAENRVPLVMIATKQLQLRAIGSTALKAAGFRVQAETRGKAVIDAIESQTPPDLILTDPSLADMDASRLCSQLRMFEAGSTVPILVISDLLQSPTVQGILAEDFTDFIPAPVNWKLLTFRIHRWISLARKFRALSEQEDDLEEVKDSALRASTELLQLRNYDSVTGLPNREMFLSMAELVVSQNRRTSGRPMVLFLDIDDFKVVNDLIGRSLGDELLKIVAKRLQGCLREGDRVSPADGQGSLTPFARLSVDQFAILISSADGKQGAVAVAERLLETLSRPLTIRSRQFRLKGRIGISEGTDVGAEGEDEGGQEELVHRAETAMRYCKQQRGKSYAFFESFMNESVIQKVELKTELLQAVDQGQLFFCYQFLVDCKTSIPTGVEALVRWQHPTRGLVPPDDFLPVAEESDLILHIDRWVLRNGCRQGKAWLDSGLPLLMSLNVSIRFLEENDFAEQILQIVDESGLPPSSLQIELSERGTLPDPGRIMAQFDKLVAKGIHLALDDFGTGQTSLSYLQSLPISCVKVDRAFVSRIPDDSNSVAIVTAIGAMSNHLGIKVVAEGVETADHYRFLAQNGYNQLQGYLFSRPERAEVVEKKLTRALAGLEVPWAELVRSGNGSPAEPTAEISQLDLPDLDVLDFAVPELEIPQLEAPPPAVEEGEPSAVEELEPSAFAELQSAVEEGKPSAVGELEPSAIAELQAAVEEGEPSAVEEPETSADEGPAVETEGRETVPEVVTADIAADSPRRPPGGTEGDEPPPERWGASEDYLLKLARHDFLTKLHNRFSFDERLEHAIAHADRFGHQVALLLIDLDDFKYVNDTHGHAVGDELLIAKAGQLENLVRKVDTLARIGGDELAVILSEFDDERNVTEFARRLLLVLAKPVNVEGRELRVTGSLGVSIYKGGGVQTGGSPAGGGPASGGPAKDLVRQADLALYKAKNNGGNCVSFFALEMDREARRDLDLARDLTGAVERGELFLEYQLQVALATGAVVGVESLLRWKHPLKGIIGPERLIPIAESTGEIRAIGRWVIRSACVQAQQWRESSGRGVRVSVNLSPVQCRDSQFVESILQALQEEELAPELLDLEVSEKLLRHLPADLEDSIERLGEAGVGLTLDDFGSGPSALEHFQRFRFDRLKIHQSLVRAVDTGSMSGSVLSGIVALARKIDVQIVAEGIEEPEELEALLAEGCDVGQGYLFSRPQTAAAVSDLMRLSREFRDYCPQDDDEPHLGGLALIPLAGEPPALREPSDRTEWVSLVEPPADLAVTEPPPAASTTARKKPRRAFLALAAVAALALLGLFFLPEGLIRSPAPPATAGLPEPATAPPAADPPPAPVDPSAEAAAAAEPEVSPRQAIDLAEGWARAWSDQRVDDYLALYAAGFRPPDGLDRGDWEALRRTRILATRRIEVTIDAVEARLVDSGRAVVSFEQSYRSDNYRDTVRKTLELVREGGGWKILAETVDDPS